MFVDKATAQIKAGNGGNGVVSFRHEKYVDRGGPDGGDGGDGGSIIAVASTSENTLAKFRYDKVVPAEDGKPGFRRKQHGKRGADFRLLLPVGTIILREGQLLADLTEEGQEVVIAKGGQGGFGNAHFVSSTRQAPRVAEKGELGDAFEATLELKTIADVGIIGLPNAGKSTFLSVVSNARPEIANYPFTTLVPNLGVADIDRDNSLLLADIPGLIEGASEGKGLGDEFLRHVERTKVLLHLIDAYENDIPAAYTTIVGELKAYSVDLTKKPQLVVITKIDGLDSEIVADQIKTLKKVLPKSTKVMAISSTSHLGVKEVLFELQKIVKKADLKAPRLVIEDPDLVVIRPKFDETAWEVEKVEGGFIVSGKKIERFASRTRFENDFSLQRLNDIFRKMGIQRELKKHGLKSGDRIQIGKTEIGSFEY